METVLFSNVKKLYDNELYPCVIQTASILNTLFQNDRMAATPEMEYQLHLFQGNSFYNERKFRLASKHLHTALLMRKALIRHKNPHLAAIENTYEHFTDIEIKYRLAVCYRELSESDLAISTLQTIANKSRSPKINMLLARLLHYAPLAKSSDAVMAYKDVLRECPLSLNAACSLLELGVDGIEVNTLVVNVSQIPKNIEWLSSWIKGHAEMYGRKHLEASKTFQSINDNSKFHQNEYILTLIGKCLYYNGNFHQAQQYLEMASMKNPYNPEPLMPLAVVYEYNNKSQELDKLAGHHININEFTSENWFVLAQGLSATGKREKATYFTHKAIAVDPRNVEAYLLRGKIYLQLKRYKEAINCFRTVQNIANYRFEIYKGLFSCYVGLKRIKEAQTLCALAARYFRHSPRSYVLLARTLVYSTNSIAKRQAKNFVTKALEIDEFYFPAVAAMAEILQSEGETQDAIRLLKKQAVSYPNCKLFIMLGDMLSSAKDLEGALEYYTIALSMEPTNPRALEGVNALGQAARTNTKPDESLSLATTTQDEEWPIDYDEPSIEAVEFSSPAVAAVDGESESDPIWSDVDTELTA